MKCQKEKVKEKSCLKLHQKYKILRDELNQEGERPYTENYKTLIKETKSDLKNGNIFHALGLEELILLKMAILPKLQI